MVELMYAAGLRVSELVSLPATAVNLRQGVLRVRGKGNQERLVPMGEEAQHLLERYLAEARPQLAGKRQLEPLFLSRGGDALSRQQFWTTVKKMAIEGQQMMGGYGYSTEYDMERYVRATLVSTSSIAVVSVTSSVRQCGGNACRCNISCTVPNRPSWVNCTADRLTAIFQSVCPSATHCAICAQARSSTHTPRPTIRPDFSARGMNSSGCINPRTGCCQRTSASAPSTWPSGAANLGW